MRSNFGDVCEMEPHLKCECGLLRSPEVPSHFKNVALCKQNKTPKSCYSFVHLSSYPLPLHSPVPFTHSPILPSIFFITFSPMQLLPSPSSICLPFSPLSYPFTHPAIHVRHGFEISLETPLPKPLFFLLYCDALLPKRYGGTSSISL